jgi:dTDP-4-dehydrorhamnose 3,5-epimerase
MKFSEQKLPGVFLLEPEPFSDDRGMLRRHYCAREFEVSGIRFDVKQCNISENHQRHTLRGFHYQTQPFAESKILSCMRGSIYDIIVDLRSSSSTYLKWISIELSASNRLALLVPAGCANAWITLEDGTWIFYYHSEFYRPDAERGLRYNQPLFEFQWPAEPEVISKKDLTHPDYVPERRTLCVPA